ncbi:MAG: bifunctional folylpolyglutamate synthase/dihydrofolate synthase, partial [Chloroflexi bacterium]
MALAPLQSYADAIDYLYSFINWEVERHIRNAPGVMTLERPREVLAAFGNPHERYPVIHITGTKGKGSVGAMCASTLTASGLKSGLYSSPHLQDFRERFRIDGQMIEPDAFTALVNQIRPVLDSVADITWFEATTALAFLFFAQQKVDMVVAEVGLGGRLDATNVVTPAVSVITSLSYDHTHLLGDSLESIAREKGGIIKPGVPVVSAPQAPGALDVLSGIASEQHAPMTVIGRDWHYVYEQSTLNGTRFKFGRA